MNYIGHSVLICTGLSLKLFQTSVLIRVAMGNELAESRKALLSIIVLLWFRLQPSPLYYGHAIPIPPTTILHPLAKLVLTLNNFSFNSSHFLQVRGVAMSTHMGPHYACLFVGYVEHSLFQSYSGPHTQLFLQYIDGIIGAATWSISDSSLPFLDISVSISGDSLATCIHYKPTDSHSSLDYTSSHPASYKDSIPLSQFIHLHRIHSDEVNFDKRASEMSIFCLKQGFPGTIVNRALNLVRPISRTSALTPSLPSCNSDSVPFVLTCHPTSIHIQKIIRCHFRHLLRDAITTHIF
eukprot:g37892.t1